MDLKIQKSLMNMSFLLLPPKQQTLHRDPLEQGPRSPSSACLGNGQEIPRTGSQEQRADFWFAVTAVYSSSRAHKHEGMPSPHLSPLTCGGVLADARDVAAVTAEAQGGCPLIQYESAATPQLPNAAASSRSLTAVICPKTLILFLRPPFWTKFHLSE